MVAFSRGSDEDRGGLPGRRVAGRLVGDATGGGVVASSPSSSVGTRMAPVKGSYRDADAMGLFWSAESATTASGVSDESDESSLPEHVVLSGVVSSRS